MATFEYQDLVDHLLAYRRSEITLQDLESLEYTVLPTFNDWQRKNYFTLRRNFIPDTKADDHPKPDDPEKKKCGCGCSGGKSCSEKAMKKLMYIGGAALILFLLMRRM